MKTQDVTQYKRSMELSGFNLATGNWSLPVILYIVVIATLIVDSFLFAIYKWDQVDKRVDGLKGLLQYIMCFIYFLPFLIDWDNAILLIKTIDGGFYRFPYRATKKRIDTEKTIMDDINRLNTIWYNTLYGYVVTMIVIPVIVFFIRTAQYKIEDIRVEMLYSIFPFYFPKNCDTLPCYFVSYILQSYYFVYGIRMAYLAVIPAFNSMQLIGGELKLLRLTIEEMDFALNIAIEKPEEEGTAQKSETRFQPNEFSCNNDNLLQDFLIHFVKHHCHLQRKIKDVIKGMQMVAFSVNSGMAILICTGIYSLVELERHEITFKLQEVMYISTLTLGLYCYGVMGEIISTEGECLRRAVYNSAWIDKPIWFKKSIKLIMTRLARPIEMRSVGLFTLNLRNLVTIAQAVYSYYNLLRNLKQ